MYLTLFLLGYGQQGKIFIGYSFTGDINNL